MSGIAPVLQNTVTKAPEAPETLVAGIRCGREHFNHPLARYCAVCGISLAGDNHRLVLGHRPPLGVLVADDGSVFSVDSDYVLGREPGDDPKVRDGRARALVMDDDEHSVSRIHGELSLQEWAVMLCDRHSASGTYIKLPGAARWTRLAAETPTEILPGSRIAIGRRTIFFASHQEPRPFEERSGAVPAAGKKQQTSAPGNRAASWRRVSAGVVVLAALVALAASRGPWRTDAPRATTTLLVSKLLFSWGSTGSRPGQFRDLEGIAVDRSGNIYVADYGNNRIQKLAPSGRVLAVWGGLGSGRFRGPTGVALDHQGNVYIADAGNSRIVKLSPSGKLLRVSGSDGTGPGQFHGLHSVAVDSQGNIYAADYYNNRIQRFSPTGKPLAVWGSPVAGSGPAQFDHPVDVAVDRWGHVDVADFGNGRIQQFSPAGKALAQFSQWGRTGTGFARPHGVAVGAKGHLYVADYANNVIQELSPSGKPLAELGPDGSAGGLFDHPVSVAVDDQGNIYVADAGTNRIEELSRG